MLGSVFGGRDRFVVKQRGLPLN